MIVFLWDYYEETNFLIYRITEAWALSRFLSLEKKFKYNPEFHTQYQKTIKEYIEKRHETKTKNEKQYKQCY